jgi:hypothetical protein
MAEKRESNISALKVKVDVDCSEALKGLKALTRAAKRATAALKELDEQQSKIAQTFNSDINLDDTTITRVVDKQFSNLIQNSLRSKGLR